ncbi:MAG: discoidin domain-containing protein [Phycisphaerae bacterium]|nr:discoidin domain-containing protein [Phycisphaerae bacterium]
MKTTNVQTVILRVGLLLATLAPVGCEMEGFNYSGERAAPGVISTNKEWTIVAHGGGFRNIRSAIDDNQLTAAQSGRNYANAVITLDLGRSCYFNCIAMLHGELEDGYPRQLSLSTSLDGQTYRHQKTVYGTRKVTYILLVQPIRARYLRFTAVRQGAQPWSISEIFLQ